MGNFIKGVRIGHMLLLSSSLRARIRLAELRSHGVTFLVGVHAMFIALILCSMIVGAGAGFVAYLLSR
jgi:hypothetical protein